MSKNLVNKIGECGQDNLIARLFPRALTTAIKIRREAKEEKVYKRGTILAVSSADGYAVILGTEAQAPADGEGETTTADPEILTASYILAKDVTVSTAEEAVAVAYRSGNFNPNAVIVADGYTLSAADKDTLRKYDIVFTNMMED